MVYLRSMRPLPRTPLLAALVAALAVGAGGGVAVYAAFSSKGEKTVVRQVTVQGSSAAASTSTLSVSEIYRRAYKGVVEITVTSDNANPFGDSSEQRAQGSGFVYDANGDIVTNEHVVDGATSVSVRFWDGSTAKARVVATDASTDLAVIKVDVSPSKLVPLSLGDSGKLLVGDGVVA